MTSPTHASPGVPAHPRRDALLGSVGTALEWFDFTLYAYLATVIAPLFFPSDDSTVSLISAFGVFSAGFLMRPLGAIYFGNYGDTKGRKAALTLSIMLMSVPMALIAVLPTYGTIGLAAPLILLALRMIQGFSVGGEFSGTLVLMSESSGGRGRGFVAALAEFTSGMGVLIAALTVTILHGLLDAQQMSEWGWRAGFGVGALIGVFALVMRLRMSETQSFQEAKAAGELSDSPVKDAVKTERGPIFTVFALSAYLGIAYYIAATFLPSYLEDTAGAKPEEVTLGATLSALVFALVVPFAGGLSDRFGRRPVMLVSAVLLLVLSYPLFAFMDEGTAFTAIAGQVVMMLFVLLFTGPFAAAITELFPTGTRFSGMSIGYNVANAIFAGTAPLIATALVQVTGLSTAPAFYVILGSILIMPVLWKMPETAFKALKR